MLKTGKVICPTCGGEVVEFDTIDVEVDTSSVTFFKVGECDLEQTHDESEDEPDDLECGFDPYEGCYTYDC